MRLLQSNFHFHFDLSPSPCSATFFFDSATYSWRSTAYSVFLFFTSLLVYTLCTGLCAVSPFAHAFCPGPAAAPSLPRPFVAEILLIVSECTPPEAVVPQPFFRPSYPHAAYHRVACFCIGKRKESEDTILDHYASIYPSP